MKPQELFQHLSGIVGERNGPSETAGEQKRYNEAELALRERAYNLLELAASKGHKINEDSWGGGQVPAGCLSTKITRRVLEVTFPASYDIQMLVPDSESTVMQTMVIGLHDLESTIDDTETTKHAASLDIVTFFTAERENLGKDDDDPNDDSHPLNDKYFLERLNVNYPVFDHQRAESERVKPYDDIVVSEEVDEAAQRSQSRGWEVTFSNMQASLDELENRV
ncbi:MAG: hypothetical protein ABI220_03270 [Candidatus Saccharimonadales bacterium]